MTGSRVHITKRAEIATSHRCARSDWNQQTNADVYGLETHRHGHNYLIEASVSGPVDNATGMVTNIKQVKAALKAVLKNFDHCDLNGDHPAFANTVPTTERVAALIYDELTKRLSGEQGHARLERLRLFENEDTCYEHVHPRSTLHQPPPRGTMLITRRYTFSAAHRLHSPHLSEAENQAVFLNCNNPNGHGHNYTLEVTAAGTVDDTTGLATNHQALDKVVREAIVDRYHYRHLNDDVAEFSGQVTTSENIIRIIWKTLAKQLSADITLHRIKLGETRDNYFEYYG